MGEGNALQQINTDFGVFGIVLAYPDFKNMNRKSALSFNHWDLAMRIPSGSYGGKQ